MYIVTPAWVDVACCKYQEISPFCRHVCWTEHMGRPVFPRAAEPCRCAPCKICAGPDACPTRGSDTDHHVDRPWSSSCVPASVYHSWFLSSSSSPPPLALLVIALVVIALFILLQVVELKVVSVQQQRREPPRSVHSEPLAPAAPGRVHDTHLA